MIITGEQNELLRGMIPFIFKDKNRGNLNCFRSESGTTVATDGKRIAITTRNILPDGNWRVVKSLKKQTELEKVDGEYPNWRQVVPDKVPEIHRLSTANGGRYEEQEASIYLCLHGLFTDENGRRCAIDHAFVWGVMQLANAANRKAITVHQHDAYTPRLFDMGDVKAIVMPLWMGRNEQ